MIPRTIDGKKVESIAKINANTVNLLIEDGVEIIKKDAFKNCVYLENIYIPASIYDIEDGAFLNCISLKNITVSHNNEYYYVKDNTLMSKDGKEIVSW